MKQIRQAAVILALTITVGNTFTSPSVAQTNRASTSAIPLRPGPHLFLDDYLIDHKDAISRTVHQPKKMAIPIVTGAAGGDSCFQPYLSVIQDPVSKRFRLWYGVPQTASRTHIAYLESRNGKVWIRPHQTLVDPFPMNFGISVLDRGGSYAPSSDRFVFASYYDDGMMLATSGDGRLWRAIAPSPVLKHNHDINSLHWDPLRNHFIAVVSMMIKSGRWKGERRIPHQSVSPDLLNWEAPWPILFPKEGVPVDAGETEFYSMSGVVTRGNTLIGLVKILRDDLNASPGPSAREMGDSTRKAAGLGYTVLAWSHDGRTWERDYEPFIPNNPVPGSWDHAMAWGDEQLIVDDSTYVYYGGYARGHKVARFDERQLGLAIMPRDRYVSFDADQNEGHIITKPFRLSGDRISVNARVIGSLKVRVLNEVGAPLSGYDYVSLTGDSVDHPLNWTAPLKIAAGSPVRLQFVLRDAQVFGFNIH